MIAFFVAIRYKRFAITDSVSSVAVSCLSVRQSLVDRFLISSSTILIFQISNSNNMLEFRHDIRRPSRLRRQIEMGYKHRVFSPSGVRTATNQN